MAQSDDDEARWPRPKEFSESLKPSGASSSRFSIFNRSDKKRSKAAKSSRSKEFSESLQPIQKIPLRKIRKATNNFNHPDLTVAYDVIRDEYYFEDYLIDKDCLKAYLSEIEYPVTVRKFKTSKWSVDNIENEKSILTGLRHDNIARLLGYCQEGKVFALIYEYSCNNNVKEILFGREVNQRELDWTGRYNLCLGIAKGLAHLHREMEIIHQDIKTANVFLNNSSNPKIAGFSWAKRARGDIIDLSTSRISGSIGYLDPEFVNSGKLTKKVDVYSYGVIILEVVRGKRCVQNDVTQLHETMDARGDLLEFIDQSIGEARRDKALKLLELSAMCTKSPSEQRPEMTEVVRVLEDDEVITQPKESSLTNAHSDVDDEVIDDEVISNAQSDVDDEVIDDEVITQPKESSLTASNAQSDVDGDGDSCTMVCDPMNSHTEPDSSSEEDSSHEEETRPLPDNEAFEKLKKLVRGNDLEKALGEEIKPKILHLCKLLLDDGSTLPESRFNCVEYVKYLLDSTSDLFSERTQYSLVVEEQHKRSKDVDASITLQITTLEIWLAEELREKDKAEKMLNCVNQWLQWKMKDWKSLQETFRWLHKS